MSLLPFLPVIERIFDRVIPDPVKSAEAKAKLLELQQAGELENLKAELSRDLAQIEINKIEAASEGKYKSYWRPTVGWMGVIGLGYATIVQPLLAWICILAGVPMPPSIDANVLMTVLGGILGIGGMRSWERRNVK